MILTEYCSMVCTSCGVEDFNSIITTEHAHISYCVPLKSVATYTRVKRFKKYLQRASMAQSASTIPQLTWDYLLEGRPYRSPAHIVRRLKKAPKNIRKKLTCVLFEPIQPSSRSLLVWMAGYHLPPSRT